MKRIIITLLALTFMLTMVVACSDDEETNSDIGSSVTNGTQPSNEELTSEELDAWGNISIEVEPGDGGLSSNDTVTSSDEAASTDTTTSTDASSTTSSTPSSSASSNDKDQGYGPWVPLG